MEDSGYLHTVAALLEDKEGSSYTHLMEHRMGHRVELDAAVKNVCHC
jgi:hypothetical protein